MKIKFLLASVIIETKTNPSLPFAWYDCAIFSKLLRLVSYKKMPCRTIRMQFKKTISYNIRYDILILKNIAYTTQVFLLAIS